MELDWSYVNKLCPLLNTGNKKQKKIHLIWKVFTHRSVLSICPLSCIHSIVKLSTTHLFTSGQSWLLCNMYTSVHVLYFSLLTRYLSTCGKEGGGSSPVICPLGLAGGCQFMMTARGSFFLGTGVRSTGAVAGTKTKIKSLVLHMHVNTQTTLHKHIPYLYSTVSNYNHERNTIMASYPHTSIINVLSQK